MSGVMEDGARVFQANRPAARLDVAVILVRALGLEALAKVNTTPLDFADKADIPEWAAGYIAVALEKGIVTGYEDKTFKPNKGVTRAEMAALLDRTNEKLDDAKVAGEIRGTIKGATEASATAPAFITLTVRGADVTVNLAEDAVIYLNKEAAASADLAEGDHATVVKNTEGLAVYVGAKRDDTLDSPP